jgi:glycosyltransferase involved in cell wall biosynthesis
MDLSGITLLILTYNEAPNIGRTLAALSWAEEIVIIDTGSTDGTIEIARSAHPNVRIIERAFDTHGAQWNFGLQQVHTPWILSLDADYELSPGFVEEIRRIEPAADIAGYEVQFQYRIFGHSLKASVYPPRVVLFRRDRCSYYDDGHTQRLRAEGVVGHLAGLIYHDDRKPLAHWLRSQDRYAIIEARHLLSAPLDKLNFQDRLRRKIFFGAPLMFLYLLFARGLIFDGWPGWFYVCQRTIAEFLLSLRLLIEREKLESRGGG